MTTLLSIGDAARHLGLSVDSVRELERSGHLRALRTPGGHRRFDAADLDAYLRRGSARSRAPQAPSPAPARRRTRPRQQPVDEPDEPWDSPEPVEVAQPSAPAEAPLVQVVEELRRATEWTAELNRIGALKSYGQSLIPFGSTGSARSAVIEALEGYVTPSRFPPSTGIWTAREAIRAKVEAILEPHNAAAARKAREEAKRAEQEQEDQQVQALIERGKSHAFIRTLRWASEDAEDARAEVLEALEVEVEADWTNRDVEKLVDETLEEWEEEDE